MTRFQEAAQKSLAEEIGDVPIPLYTVSVMADEAARAAGKKRDLFNTLAEYEQVLPEGWRVERLHVEEGSGEELLHAVPPDWLEEEGHTGQRLLGPGILRVVRKQSSPMMG